MAMAGKLHIQFETERSRLGTLHPGELFYYKKSLWVTLNRTDTGRLIKMYGCGSQVSDVRPTKTMVTRLRQGRKVR
jgi:hypothetical protein